MGYLTVNGVDGAIGVVMFLIGIGSFVVTLIWLRIGWRAMKAHERLSDAVESMARGADSSSSRKRMNP
jgi:cytochrome b561